MTSGLLPELTMRWSSAVAIALCWCLVLAGAGTAKPAAGDFQLAPTTVLVCRSSLGTTVASPQRKVYVKAEEELLGSLAPADAAAVGLEVWLSRDGGATWTRYLRQVDTRKAALVRFRADGIYGVYVAKVPPDESQHTPPAAGVEPQLSVLVDTARPVIRVARPSEDTLIKAGSPVEIAWSASDANPVADGVALAFSPDGGATWVPVAKGKAYTGSHLWMSPEVDLGRYTVRATVIDAAGNEAAATARGRILADGLPPVCAFSAAPRTTGARIEVSFWAEDMGPAGLEKVQLWTTADNGATWRPAGAAMAGADELVVSLAAGTYGLWLSGTDNVGNAVAPPEPGSPAQVQVTIASGQELFAVKTEAEAPAGGPAVEVAEPVAAAEVAVEEPVALAVTAPEAAPRRYPMESELARMSPDEILELAHQHYEREDYPRAKAYYTYLIKADPTNARAHLGLGRIYVLTRQFSYSSIKSSLQAARFEFERALELDPTLAAAYCAVGHVYSLGEDTQDRALGAFEKAVQLEPENPIYRYNYGLHLKRAGLVVLAIAHLSRCVELAPDYDKALYVLADCYTRLKEWKQAADTWKRLASVAGADSELGRYALKQLEAVRPGR